MEDGRNHLFCLADVDLIGFDLDHTIAKFNLVPNFKLAYNSVIEYLIKEKGYSSALREDIEVNKDFCTKGLVLDQAHGNLIKLSYDGSILRASHGTRILKKSEIEETYGKDRKWEYFDYVKEHVNSDHKNFRLFENYFDVIGAVASAKVVDVLDRENGGPLDKYTFFEDVFGGFIHCYRYQAFEENNGGYFPELKKSPEIYYRKCNEKIRNWLKSLKSQNKFVFLMTSSFVDFGKHTLQYTLGDDWQSYFDLCIFFARKPTFFETDRPFLRLDGNVEKEPVNELVRGQCYSQGNITVLTKFFQKLSGKDNPKVVYFGDSVRSDVFPTKTKAGWDVAMIIEEMEAEGYTLHDLNMAHDSDNEDEAPRNKRRKHEAVCVSTLDQEEKNYLLSDAWGSFFTDDIGDVPDDHIGPHRHMNTFWGWAISQYCDIALPNIEYIADLPLRHKFKSFRPGSESQDMLGFHPGVPLSLQKYEHENDV